MSVCGAGRRGPVQPGGSRLGSKPSDADQAVSSGGDVRVRAWFTSSYRPLNPARLGPTGRRSQSPLRTFPLIRAPTGCCYGARRIVVPRPCAGHRSLPEPVGPHRLVDALRPARGDRRPVGSLQPPHEHPRRASACSQGRRSGARPAPRPERPQTQPRLWYPRRTGHLFLRPPGLRRPEPTAVLLQLLAPHSGRLRSGGRDRRHPG